MGGAMLGAGLRPFAVAAQDKTPVRGGTLIWGHSETTQNLDMHQTGTASTGRLLQNVHDAIVTVDEDFTVIPSLAESFELGEDGLTYTFKLRPDVKFHDGKTMTSADVKYSFERVKDPDTGAVNFEVFNDVESIETPDDLTVIVKMSEVHAPFLSRLAEHGAGVVMPEGSGDIQGTTPIGCGPFKFVRREFGTEVELVRFDDYWQGAPYLDGVLSREVTEPTVRLTGLRTGEMHLINDIPLDRVEQLKEDPDLQVLTWFPLSWAFLNFNHAVAPFDDPRVRKALDLMVDKEVLVQGALWGQGVVTASPSFPTSPTSWLRARVLRDRTSSCRQS
jgi:peptide/nickel transport system substrate-binding protein